MADRRFPISTVALLAMVGVSKAHGQSFEELPLTSAGSSAGIKIGGPLYAPLHGSRSVVLSRSVLAPLVAGLDRGVPPLFLDAATPPIVGGVPVSDHLWTYEAGDFAPGPDLGSLSTLVAPAANGDFAVGSMPGSVGSMGSCCPGVRVDKLGSMTLIPAPMGSAPVWVLDVNAIGDIAVGTAGNPGATAPMYWLEAVGSLPLGVLPGHATRITPDGSAIGGMIDEGSGMQWTRWRFDGATYVEDRPASVIVGTVSGISANGDHLVGRLADGSAAAWIEGQGLVVIGDGEALAVSDDGLVVVGTDRTRTQAWIWTNPGGRRPLSDYLADLGLPPSSLPLMAAAGMSPEGSAITGWMGETDLVETSDAPPDPIGLMPNTSALSISGTLDGGADAHDVYGIFITDPDQFYATTSPVVDARASAGFDTRLWLFRPDGQLVMGNDDGPGGAPFLSTISDPADFTALTGGILAPTAPGALTPGEYLLVISGYPEDPLDGAGVRVADLDSDFDALHGPNPASSEFFGFWELSGYTGANYTIALRGVTPTLPQRGWLFNLFGCQGDIDGSGAIDFGDILAILSAWGGDGGPADLDRSRVVDFGDILFILGRWGPCI